MAASDSSSAPTISCPECGGDCVPAWFSGVDGPGPGDKTWQVRRAGTLFSGFSFVRAVACTDCGLIRFYAEKPSALLPDH
jgi:DNA-directed RNA polymerase subunit RPC12/RpoP